jgi:adenylate cyclase
MKQPVERRLAAILAADVVGYSRLMGADEEGTHERFTAHLAELVNPKIAQYHGRIVKTTGDGLLVEFASVVDAVRLAAEVQREMAARNVSIAADQRIAFRIGINLGDIIVERHDIMSRRASKPWLSPAGSAAAASCATRCGTSWTSPSRMR